MRGLPSDSGGLVVRTFLDGASRSFPLPASGRVVVGRAAEAYVRIDSPSVSRLHAAIHVGAEIEVEDLGSANGTRIGKRHVAKGERARVAVGDAIAIGAATLIVQAAPADAAAPREAASTAAEEGPALFASTLMRQLEPIVRRVAPSHLNVLLFGETGVGKEVMAELLHRQSRRASGPFVAFNCAALSETLLESELFGHERGAFTGAHQPKVGLVEAAHGGTLFLDEIGEMPLGVQAKLLRLVQDKKVVRVGSVRSREVDVRFIAATNRDLEQEMERGGFRTDFYFRLNGITITIPPLRDRASEIVSLAEMFAADAAAKQGVPTPTFSAAVTELLWRYPWPGNVRELKNVVERAVVLAGDEPLDVRHFPADQMRKARVVVRPAVAGEPPPEATTERDRILAALAHCAGNQSQAAKLVGISRNTFVARLEEYGVARPRKRS